MYFSAFQHKGRFRRLVDNWPNDNVQICVVSERFSLFFQRPLHPEGCKDRVCCPLLSKCHQPRFLLKLVTTKLRELQPTVAASSALATSAPTASASASAR